MAQLGRFLHNINICVHFWPKFGVLTPGGAFIGTPSTVMQLIRPKKMLPLREKKSCEGAFNFFFENRGIPENFWEFLKISGNSRGDFLNFGKKSKKKKVVGPKSGKKVVGAQR